MPVRTLADPPWHKDVFASNKLCGHVLQASNFPNHEQFSDSCRANRYAFEAQPEAIFSRISFRDISKGCAQVRDIDRPYLGREKSFDLLWDIRAVTLAGRCGGSGGPADRRGAWDVHRPVCNNGRTSMQNLAHNPVGLTPRLPTVERPATIVFIVVGPIHFPIGCGCSEFR